jgi:uncharacterized repeat protein (TIGR03803 family)
MSSVNKVIQFKINKSKEFAMNSPMVKHRKSSIVFAFLILAMQAALFAQSEKTIFVFNGTTDGGDPGGGLVADSSGALYGTTMKGGSASLGTVFKLSPPSEKGAPWTESVLYSFQGGETDGASPFYVTPAFDSHGNLYGTTASGGANGVGTVFRLTPPSEPRGSWTESVIFSFSGNEDAVLAGVTIDAAGAIYGPEGGGAYQLLPSGGTWDYSVIYGPEGDDGNIPSSLTLSEGTLYGADTKGGNYYDGSVFTLEEGSNGEWEPDTIWSFSGARRDGSVPESTITLASGVVYGTTAYGASGYGMVYSLTPPAAPGGDWTETILYEFTGGANGAYPMGGVIFGSEGELYGTTSAGGSANLGTIFKVAPPTVNGDPWTCTVLHSFSGTNDDYGQPENTLLLRKGIFYGTTSGGANKSGTVFEITE